MAWGLLRLCWVCVCLCVCVRPCLGMPPQHHGWLRLWQEGESCAECEGQRCPAAPPSCPAGTVRDHCGCCEQCGNVEGQLCDPDGAQHFYGRCGEGLTCQRRPRRKGRRGRRRGNPEPMCVCESKDAVCGSDGQTYINLCRLREASSKLTSALRQAGAGPCYSAPRVSRGPRDLANYTGNDIVFGCEVTAYPLPILSWRKTGAETILPGDDPHVTVQVRGGPQRYTVTTWLQIHSLHLTDDGTYTCVSHNALGEASAAARLTVLTQVTTGRVADGNLYEDDYYYDSSGGKEENNVQGSGDSSGSPDTNT